MHYGNKQWSDEENSKTTGVISDFRNSVQSGHTEDVVAKELAVELLKNDKFDVFVNRLKNDDPVDSVAQHIKHWNKIVAGDPSVEPKTASEKKFYGTFPYKNSKVKS